MTPSPQNSQTLSQLLPCDPHIMRMLQGDSDERSTAISEMNVIPFIDICLVLLIIVLMSSVFAFQLFVFRNPQAPAMKTFQASLEEGSENIIRVKMTARDKFDINGRMISLERLTEEIRTISETLSVLEFLASGDMPSQAVVSAWERIRQANGELKLSMNILVNQKQQNSKQK